MNKRRIVIIFVIILVVFGVGGYVLVSRDEIEPDVAVVVEPEVEQRVIGISVEGRAIEAYTFLPAGASGQPGSEEKKHIVFVGGIHGGYEWNSSLLAYEFIDYLTNNPAAIPDGVQVTIIPSLNPDGMYAISGRDGRFTTDDVPTDRDETVPGRFNARGVDLNRNFDCKWQPESTWRGNVVSAGNEPFSEPEAAAFRDFVFETNPDAVVFWHSQANAVYASECEDGILAETLFVMDRYADAAGYPAIDSFDAYEITGDAEGWLAQVGIPAITVELSTHEVIEWERNLNGFESLLEYYSG